MANFNNFLNPPPNMPPPPITAPPICKCKIMIGLENAPVEFNLRGRIIGDAGTNLTYIRSETGANVSLRGMGSLFVDPAIGTESTEPMHLYVETTTLQALQEAKQLAKNLIETLQEELSLFQDNKQNYQLMPHQIAQPPPQIQQITPLIRTQHIAQPPNIIQQPAFIQQSVPIQQNSIIVQQQMANYNNPPPPQMRQPPPVAQLKIPPTNNFVNLSQPPPNLQIQPTNQPILINQGSPFQLQYVHHPNTQIQTANLQNPGQITVQHLIQPQVMQTTIPQQFERQGQIFTLQTQPVNQNFIIHQPLVNQIQQHELSQQIVSQHQVQHQTVNHIPIEDKKPFDGEIRPKIEGNKQEENKHAVHINSLQLNQPPPPIMSLPPPQNMQQHVITTNPISFPQIYGQIPMTIHHQPQHQIHVNGSSQFVINPQQQQISGHNTIQNIQFAQMRNPNEIIIGNSNHAIINQPNMIDPRQQIQNHQQIIFNPQMQPPQNVQLASQPPPPLPVIENNQSGQNFNHTITTYTMQDQKHGQKRKMQDDGAYSPSMQGEIPSKYGLYDTRKGLVNDKMNEAPPVPVKMGMGLNQRDTSMIDGKQNYKRVSTTSTTSDEMPEEYDQMNRMIKIEDKDGPSNYIRNAPPVAGNYRIGQFVGQNPNIRPNMYPNATNMGPQRDYSTQ